MKRFNRWLNAFPQKLRDGFAGQPTDTRTVYTTGGAAV